MDNENLLKFARECLDFAQGGDYANGNEAFGSDEGRVLAGKYFDSLEKRYEALQHIPEVKAVKEILDKGRTGIKITNNGIANFIEYNISTKEQASQICQLFERKEDNAK